MRSEQFLKFDRQAIEALQKLGFDVGADVANIGIGDMNQTDITVLRLADTTDADFLVMLTLPNGTELACFTRRPALLKAASETNQ